MGRPSGLPMIFDKQKTYHKDRLECYLQPLQRINDWKNIDAPIIAEQYADIISDLKSIGLHKEAELLCDRVIDSLDDLSASHAYFIKGCTMIHRFDSSGIEYIYHAIENNKNYLNVGLNEIGTFCCMVGLQSELQVYRNRAVELAQEDKDEYSKIGYLSKNDNLTADDMPIDMLQEILSFMRSVDNDFIQNIYLVRKTINDHFFTSAFVIQFCGGSPEQRHQIMHKIFCYLDTYPKDWQFSLFDYNEYSDIKFYKIKGCLVYSKYQQKGDS